LERWLTALPPEALRRRPRLVLGRAIVGVLGGRLDDVEPLLGAVEQADFCPPYRPSVRRRTSIMSNLDACVALCRADLAYVRGDADHVVEFARVALARSDEADELLREMAQVLLAETDWLAGRLAEAERALTGILMRWSSSQEWLVLQRVGFDLGCVQLAQGRLGAALRTYRPLGARTDAAAPALAGISHVGVAMSSTASRGHRVDQHPQRDLIRPHHHTLAHDRRPCQPDHPRRSRHADRSRTTRSSA
jgi:LuxR family transcriptional regulator, maltose regulon positive regulatory protein